ncbi:MAG: hypothetical protein U0992_24925 [Planctomycetaceae bacterium]
MNARTSIAAFAVAAALSLTNASHTHAGFNFDRDFRNIFGNGFNNNFGGNNRNFFRQADRVVFSDRVLRREVRDLPFNQQFVLDRLTNEVELRTNQLVFAVRTDNHRLIEVRARQLIQAVNEIDFIVDRLPIRNFRANEVQRAERALENDVRDLLRTF